MLRLLLKWYDSRPTEMPDKHLSGVGGLFVAISAVVAVSLSCVESLLLNHRETLVATVAVSAK
jgi:hypothetical protein